MIPGAISVCPTIIAKARSSIIGIIVSGEVIRKSGEVSLPHYSTKVKEIRE